MLLPYMQGCMSLHISISAPVVCAVLLLGRGMSDTHTPQGVVVLHASAAAVCLLGWMADLCMCSTSAFDVRLWYTFVYCASVY